MTLRANKHGAGITCHSKLLEGASPMERLRGLMENREPNGMDGDYRKFNFRQPVWWGGGEDDISVDLDYQDGLRKIHGDEVAYKNRNHTRVIYCRRHKQETDCKMFKSWFTVTASDVKMGKPDAGRFRVPTEWRCDMVHGETYAFEGMPEPSQFATLFVKRIADVAPQLPRAEGDKAWVRTKL
eukprot:UN0577